MYLINETLPSILSERIFVISVAIISTMINIIIFSNVAVILGQISQKDV